MVGADALFQSAYALGEPLDAGLQVRTLRSAFRSFSAGWRVPISLDRRLNVQIKRHDGPRQTEQNERPGRDGRAERENEAGTRFLMA